MQDITLEEALDRLSKTADELFSEAKVNLHLSIAIAVNRDIKYGVNEYGELMFWHEEEA